MDHAQKLTAVKAHLERIMPLFGAPAVHVHDVALRVLEIEAANLVAEDGTFRAYRVDLALMAVMEAAPHLFKRDDGDTSITPTTPELSAAEQERTRLKAWLASDEGKAASPQARMAAADKLLLSEQRAEKSAGNIAFERYMQTKIKSFGSLWDTFTPERKNYESNAAKMEFDAKRSGGTTQ